MSAEPCGASLSLQRKAAQSLFEAFKGLVQVCSEGQRMWSPIGQRIGISGIDPFNLFRHFHVHRIAERVMVASDTFRHTYGAEYVETGQYTGLEAGQAAQRLRMMPRSVLGARCGPSLARWGDPTEGGVLMAKVSKEAEPEENQQKINIME